MRVKASICSIALLLSSAGAFAATVTLGGTVRDFNPDGANFEGAITGLRTDAVGATLTGAAPTLTASGATHISNGGAGAFDNWYTKASDTTSHSLTLSETTPGSGIYSYSSSSFFPIDGQLLGNGGNSHNYHFTYSIAATFGYRPGAGQTFTFSGDDDVWVYFDNKLGIDLGGVHGEAGASVNLDALFGPGKAAGNYAFNFFFAERHLIGSNLRIDTSLLLVDNSVPEPASLALVALALGAIGTARRVRRT